MLAKADAAQADLRTLARRVARWSRDAASLASEVDDRALLLELGRQAQRLAELEEHARTQHVSSLGRENAMLRDELRNLVRICRLLLDPAEDGEDGQEPQTQRGLQQQQQQEQQPQQVPASARQGVHWRSLGAREVQNLGQQQQQQQQQYHHPRILPHHLPPNRGQAAAKRHDYGSPQRQRGSTGPFVSTFVPERGAAGGGRTSGFGEGPAVGTVGPVGAAGALAGAGAPYQGDSPEALTAAQFQLQNDPSFSNLALATQGGAAPTGPSAPTAAAAYSPYGRGLYGTGLYDSGYDALVEARQVADILRDLAAAEAEAAKAMEEAAAAEAEAEAEVAAAEAAAAVEARAMQLLSTWPQRSLEAEFGEYTLNPRGGGGDMAREVSGSSRGGRVGAAEGGGVLPAGGVPAGRATDQGQGQGQGEMEAVQAQEEDAGEDVEGASTEDEAVSPTGLHGMQQQQQHEQQQQQHKEEGATVGEGVEAAVMGSAKGDDSFGGFVVAGEGYKGGPEGAAGVVTGTPVGTPVKGVESALSPSPSTPVYQGVSLGPAASSDPTRTPHYHAYPHRPAVQHQQQQAQDSPTTPADRDATTDKAVQYGSQPSVSDSTLPFAAYGTAAGYPAAGGGGGGVVASRGSPPPSAPRTPQQLHQTQGVESAEGPSSSSAGTVAPTSASVASGSVSGPSAAAISPIPYVVMGYPAAAPVPREPAVAGAGAAATPAAAAAAGAPGGAAGLGAPASSAAALDLLLLQEVEKLKRVNQALASTLRTYASATDRLGVAAAASGGGASAPSSPPNPTTTTTHRGGAAAEAGDTLAPRSNTPVTYGATAGVTSLSATFGALDLPSSYRTTGSAYGTAAGGSTAAVEAGGAAGAGATAYPAVPEAVTDVWASTRVADEPTRAGGVAAQWDSNNRGGGGGLTYGSRTAGYGISAGSQAPRATAAILASHVHSLDRSLDEQVRQIRDEVRHVRQELEAQRRDVLLAAAAATAPQVSSSAGPATLGYGRPAGSPGDVAGAVGLEGGVGDAGMLAAPLAAWRLSQLRDEVSDLRRQVQCDRLSYSLGLGLSANAERHAYGSASSTMFQDLQRRIDSLLSPRA